MPALPPLPGVFGMAGARLSPTLVNKATSFVAAGTITLGWTPQANNVLVAVATSGQGIVPTLPTGGGATWALGGILTTNGNGAGAAIFFGQIGASPSPSVTVTNLGNAAQWFFFELTNCKVIVDVSGNTGTTQAATQVVSFTPSKQGVAVAVLCNRSGSAGVIDNGWVSLFAGATPLGGAITGFRLIRATQIGRAVTATFVTIGTNSGAVAANIGGY